MSRKLIFGQKYEVTFWDHATGDVAILFKAIGYFVKQDDLCIELTSWFALTDDTEMRDNNYESYVIVKSCIKKLIKVK